MYGSHIGIATTGIAYLALLGPTTEGNKDGSVANAQKYGWQHGEQGEGEPILPLVDSGKNSEAYELEVILYMRPAHSLGIVEIGNITCRRLGIHVENKEIW